MDQFESMSLFARVVERGSFSQVARETGLSQPTISKCISALERRLGARLLNRSTRQVKATETGRDYYIECRRILEAVEQAAANVSNLQSRATGVLRVSTPISFGRIFVADRVASFLANNPELRIDLDMHDHPVDLIREGYDLAIRTGRLEESTLIARRIGRNHRVMVASPGYLAGRGTPATPEDLARHNCVRTGDEWRLDGPDGEFLVQVSGNLRSNNAEAVLSAVLQHSGIGVLPLWAVHREIASGTLKIVLPDYRPAAKDIYAVYPYTRKPPSKVRLFIEFLEENLRKVDYDARQHAAGPGQRGTPRRRRHPA